jgi:hypothetical protein
MPGFKSLHLFDKNLSSTMARRVWHRELLVWLLISFSGLASSTFKQLASGYDDGTVRLWDLATGALTRTLNTTAQQVFALAYSPDGKQLAASSDDGVTRLWDPATGALTQTLNTTTAATVYAVAYSPRQHGSLSTGAEAGIGVGAGVVIIILGVGLLLLRRKQRRSRDVAPVQEIPDYVAKPELHNSELPRPDGGAKVAPLEKSQERFEKPELHNSDLPRTHGRGELDGRLISELGGRPMEGNRTSHMAGKVFEIVS